MNNEKQTVSNENPLRLTKRGEFLLRAGKIAGSVALTGAAIAGTGALIEANNSEFHGQQTERIDTEKTVTDLAEQVDGVENGNLNATVDKIVRDNPQVFQKGSSAIEYQDIGQDVTIPKSVD
jgi:uncharacterized protein YwgA